MIDLLSDYCKKIELDITDTQLQQFDDYYRFLVEKNKVMNLTTIIEKEDVVLKHFIDSIYICIGPQAALVKDRLPRDGGGGAKRQKGSGGRHRRPEGFHPAAISPLPYIIPP